VELLPKFEARTRKISLVRHRNINKNACTMPIMRT